MKLAGIVAILSEDASAVIEVKDLGPVPIDVKEGRVLPLEDATVALKDNEYLGFETFVITNDKVIRNWEILKKPLTNLQPYQFFAMLELSGQKDNLNNFIASLPSPQNVIAKAKLEHTLYFEREDPIVLQAQAALGISDETLDALWTQALTF